jgi:hypothetical protein
MEARVGCQQSTRRLHPFRVPVFLWPLLGLRSASPCAPPQAIRLATFVAFPFQGYYGAAPQRLSNKGPLSSSHLLVSAPFDSPFPRQRESGVEIGCLAAGVECRGSVVRRPTPVARRPDSEPSRIVNDPATSPIPILSQTDSRQTLTRPQPAPPAQTAPAFSPPPRPTRNEELVAAVAKVYHGLPAHERTDCAIYGFAYP